MSKAHLRYYLNVISPEEFFSGAIRKSDNIRKRRGSRPQPQLAPIEPIDEDVLSSNLKKVVYQPDTGLLQIHFKSGSVYYYYKIPRPIFDGLMQASSKGKYFISKIKDKYPFERKL